VSAMPTIVFDNIMMKASTWVIAGKKHLCLLISRYWPCVDGVSLCALNWFLDFSLFNNLRQIFCFSFKRENYAWSVVFPVPGSRPSGKP
jgi:hypothetical protein